MNRADFSRQASNQAGTARPHHVERHCTCAGPATRWLAARAAAALLVISLSVALGPAVAKPTAAPAKPAAPVAAPLPAPTPESFCAAVGKRIPGVSLAQCTAATLQDTGARSVRGAPIMLREVRGDAAKPAFDPAPEPLPDAALASATVITPAASQATGEARVDSAPRTTTTATTLRDDSITPRRVLVLGAIHGDELTAATLAMAWLAAADKARPDELSRRISWRFVPVLNPDGVLGGKPARTNARGVDLNRNFPTPGWETEAPKWWQQSTRRDPRRFPGPQALSEPETRWVTAEMAAWQPDLIVSIHAPFGVLDFDGPVDPPRRIGRLWLDPVGVYPGSLGNYGGLHKGVPVLTIELPHALRPPADADMQLMWRDMLSWIENRWQHRLAADKAVTTPAH